MRRISMVPQIQGPHMEMRRQIASGRLPVARRAEEAVQDDQGRVTRAAQVAMKQKHRLRRPQTGVRSQWKSKDRGAQAEPGLLATKRREMTRKHESGWLYFRVISRLFVAKKIAAGA
jgi:hypothetical protein